MLKYLLDRGRFYVVIVCAQNFCNDFSRCSCRLIETLMWVTNTAVRAYKYYDIYMQWLGLADILRIK
jgi:hypothetical protein